MMGQEETIRLLQECDAGVQMGIASIQEVLPYVKEEKFRQLLLGCRDKHEKLQEEIRQKLEVNRDEKKEPNLMAKGMFWMSRFASSGEPFQAPFEYLIRLMPGYGMCENTISAVLISSGNS